EILDGVEGLVHISELAQHHVENPREIIQPGDEVKVKILEIDSERRRLSLSIKRVEGQVLPLREPEPATDDAGGEFDGSGLDDVPALGLSEDVFAGGESAPAEEADSAASEPEASAPAEAPAAVEEPAAPDGDGAAPAEAEAEADAAAEDTTPQA